MAFPAADSRTTSAHIATLIRSFSLVPAPAVPAIVDCVLASSPSLSASHLFSSLLDALPDVLQDWWREEGSNSGSTRTKVVMSYANALFHLVENAEMGCDALELLVWRGVIPMLQATTPDDKELLGQIIEMLGEVVSSFKAWELMEETIVLSCLRSIGLCIGMVRSGEQAVFHWSKESPTHYQKYGLDASFSLPLPIACRTLASLMDAALREKFQRKAQGEEELELIGKSVSSNGFVCKLTWDLYYMVIDMLSQCSEHRSCALHFLLPAIFRAFTAFPSFNVGVQGHSHTLSRHCFLRRTWKCCLSLFALGQLERQDAYNILSLHFGFHTDTNVNQYLTGEEFDIRSEKEFWDEIRKGLVHKDAMTRKLSLHILKLSLENQHIPPRCDDSEFSTSDLNLSIKDDPTTDGSLVGIGVSRRQRWANKEAESLGVGEIHDFSDKCSGWQRWRAFLLLYEMLEEYGTHLVEAAWTHQVYLLLQSGPSGTHADCVDGGTCQFQMETIEGMLSWLTLLWERGFVHENPQVRCLIMQSFLSFDWETHGSCARQVPKKFILGPLIQGLNDVVHHKDFGSKGTYTSRTILDASRFFRQSCGHFPKSVRMEFLCCLASVARQESFGRAGLLVLAFCISAACRKNACNENIADYQERNCTNVGQIQSAQENCSNYDAPELLDALGIIIERCKQHFNPKYRLQVCEQVFDAAYLVVEVCEVPLDVLLHFLSTIPREFTDFGGPLRKKVQEWLSKSSKNGAVDSDDSEAGVLRNLSCFPVTFVEYQPFSHNSISFDDDDLNAWVLESHRWARVLFLVITRAHYLEQILTFLKKYGTNICSYNANLDWIPVKYLILIIGLIEELQYSVNKSSCYAEATHKNKVGAIGILGQLSTQAADVYKNFLTAFLTISEELMQFAKSACNIFWSNPVDEDGTLPSSIKGRLGGPSQRRLSSSTATVVLQAIISIKCIAGVFSLFTWTKEEPCYKSFFMFLLKFSLMVISSPSYHTESGSEIHLAAYEALVPVFRTLSFAFSPLTAGIVRDYNKSLHPTEEDKPLLDPLLLEFLRSINDFLENGVLTRSRRAVLMNWKWLCLDSLLSIPYNIFDEGGLDPNSNALYSDSSLKSTFLDVVESLENASEASALPMLRSVRLILGLFGSEGITSVVTSLNSQLTQQLVKSSWILHVSCNKRRVAPIAALLSSILHPSLFGDPSMHEAEDGEKGPLKCFIEQLLDEGTKSPRTIRLAACHLTGLWLSYPRIIKYYIKELKLLTLHGSVAFDEDFEAELTENLEAKTEALMLAQSPYSEFSEAYINTEMYARVSVAILFNKLSEMANKVKEEKLNADAIFAHQSGRLYLLELLDSVVNDKDLAKELYKKYSAVHRRKVRAWQMICVLSPYVEDDIIQQVTSMLHICLYRGNLPAVRQYIEIFSIQIYLKFPALIKQQLIPLFRDYNMRPQALSSYVFIAANLIIHAGERSLQLSHLNELLPPIIPLLTSHHHSLRGFTQVLVYHVLSKLVPIIDLNQSDALQLERKCFEDLKSYLAKNTDCVRLRASMETFFDYFNPKVLATPAGIFSARNEASEFECVSVSLMEQVVTFLNDVREELRYSMAKDTMIIRNESLKANGVCRKMETFQDRLADATTSESHRDLAMNFQKKITFPEHEKRPLIPDSDCYSGIFEFPRSLVEMEKEDLLLSHLAQSRCLEMEKLRESRQQFILVASLLDRIPNLAGLARTCEIFKATGLAVADASILQDKQFQLISVTAEKWVPIIEVPVCSMKIFFEKKKREGFSILGLEQTANSTPLDCYSFPTKTVLVLGREKEGIPVDIIHALDACLEIPQLGIIRSLNVHVSGAIALWEYTRQQRRKST